MRGGLAAGDPDGPGLARFLRFCHRGARRAGRTPGVRGIGESGIVTVSTKGLSFMAGAGALLIVSAGVATAGPQPVPRDAPVSFTAGQAEKGLVGYRTWCADCHGTDLDDGEFGGPPLKGAAFRARWFGRPAGALVGFMRDAMPPDAPGRLPPGSYVEIAAYLLDANGVPPGARELPAEMERLNRLRLEAPVTEAIKGGGNQAGALAKTPGLVPQP